MDLGLVAAGHIKLHALASNTRVRAAALKPGPPQPVGDPQRLEIRLRHLPAHAAAPILAHLRPAPGRCEGGADGARKKTRRPAPCWRNHSTLSETSIDGVCGGRMNHVGVIVRTLYSRSCATRKRAPVRRLTGPSSKGAGPAPPRPRRRRSPASPLVTHLGKGGPTYFRPRPPAICRLMGRRPWRSPAQTCAQRRVKRGRASPDLLRIRRPYPRESLTSRP